MNDKQEKKNARDQSSELNGTTSKKPTREENAAQVRDALVPGKIAAAISNGKVSAFTVRDYRDQVLHESGDPKDPVERMMLDLLVVSHGRVLDLHGVAAGVKDAQATEKYSNAAARLTGEFRRLAMALKQYREPASGRTTTVVHLVQHQHIQQQNLVHEGKQDVSYTDSKGGSQLNCRDSELVSNPDRKEGITDANDRFTPEEPPAGRRRQTKPQAAATAD